MTQTRPRMASLYSITIMKHSIHDAFKTLLLAILVGFAVANWMEHHAVQEDLATKSKAADAWKLENRIKDAWNRAEQQLLVPPLRCPITETGDCGSEA